MERRMDALSTTLEDGLATITLIRPDASNAMGAAFARELREVAMGLMGEPSLRAVLIVAEGRNFSVGGDLGDFDGQLDLPAIVKGLTIDFHAALAMLARVDAPVVCGVQGAAAGGGLALAALCDYVVAERSATFTFAYPGIGFTADGGLTWTLPRLIGLRRFQTFVLEGRSVTAQEAYEIGLISRVVDDGAMSEAALAFARRLAQGPTRSFGALRRLAHASFSQRFEAQLEDEAESMFRVAGTEDARSAIAAVRRRQRPTFNGR